MSKCKLSATQRFMVFERCQFTCSYCGAKAPDVELHIDHVRPRAGYGDPPGINGYTAACADCNIGKGSLDVKTGRRCSPNVKIQDADVVKAHERIMAGESYDAVAKDFGVSKSALHYRRTLLGLEKRSRGLNPKKFSDEDVLKAAAMVRAGHSYRDAGAAVGINSKALGWRLRRANLVRGLHSDFSISASWGF